MGDRNERGHQMVVLNVKANKIKSILEDNCKIGSLQGYQGGSILSSLEQNN